MATDIALSRLKTRAQAPIHKLPPEILCQIFIADGSVNELRPRVDIPGFVFAAVCSYWRAVALVTIELWNSISLILVTLDSFSQWSSKNYAVVQRLLDLSFGTSLSITIDIFSYSAETPTILQMLCDQAHRWENLEFASISHLPLQFISGLSLNSLRTFKFTLGLPGQFSLSESVFDNVHPLNAPRLRKVCLGLINPNIPFIPWGQITDLTVRKGSIPHIIDTIPQLPALSKLNVEGIPNTSDDESDLARVHHDKTRIECDLDSLTIVFSNSLRGKHAMQSLLDRLILPCLTSFTLIADDENLSGTILPSLLTRSSARLTSLILQKTSTPANDLISLLVLMPNLITLTLSESLFKKRSRTRCMINKDFWTALSLGSDLSSLQGLVPSLRSLSLEIRYLPFSINLTMLLRLITSRHAYLKSLSLKFPTKSLSPSEVLLQSCVDFRKGGLDIRIEDQNGDVIFRRQQRLGGIESVAELVSMDSDSDVIDV